MWFIVAGAPQDAVEQARHSFHAHLSSVGRMQKETVHYTDEELMMEEKEPEPELLSGVVLLHIIIFTLNISAAADYGTALPRLHPWATLQSAT